MSVVIELLKHKQPHTPIGPHCQIGAKANSSSTNNTRIQDFLFQNFTGTINEYVSPYGFRLACVPDRVTRTTVNLDTSKALA